MFPDPYNVVLTALFWCCFFLFLENRRFRDFAKALFVFLYLPIINAEVIGGPIYIKDHTLWVDEPSGITFVESFFHPNEEMWTMQEGLHCNGPRNTGTRFKCVYRDPANIHYLHSPPMNDASSGDTEVDLVYNNKCKGLHCCDEDAQCTRLTTAQMTSKKTYTYGTFRFLAKMASSCTVEPEKWCYEQAWKFKHCEAWARAGECKTNANYMTSCCRTECGVCGPSHSKFTMWDVISCVSIQNSEEEAAVHSVQGISICIAALRPHEATFVYQYKGLLHNKNFRMPFSAGTQNTLFRIDWDPEKIQWWINGAIIHTIRAPEFNIPRRPLRIRMFILPNARQGTGDETQNMELRMRVFRVRYRRFTDVNMTWAMMPERLPPGKTHPIYNHTFNPFGSEPTEEDTDEGDSPEEEEDNSEDINHTELFIDDRSSLSARVVMATAVIVLCLASVVMAICKSLTKRCDSEMSFQNGGQYILISD